MEPLRLELKFGEQLTSLSPTVCRRAIAALRKADADAGGNQRTEPLPAYCGFLLALLRKQVVADSIFDECRPAQFRDLFVNALAEAERFLDIVEGKESAAAEPEPAPTPPAK